MLAKHGAIYLLAKIVPAALSLAALAVFTRYLTPAEYGIYSLTIVTAGLFNAVFLQWVGLGVGRYLPDCRNEASLAKLIGTARLAVLFIAVSLFPAFLLLEHYKSFTNFSILFYLLGFLVLAQSWYDLNLRIMNAQLRPAHYGLVLASKSMVAFTIGALAVYAGYGAESVIVALIIALFSATVFSVKTWRTIPWRAGNKQELTRLWLYGAPLTITYLLTFIVDASDRFFIDYMLGSQELGIYSAAYDFTQYSVGTLLSVVHLAAFPLVVNAYSSAGASGAQDELKKVFIFVLAVLAPVCAGLATVSDSVSQIIFGENFTEKSAEVIPLISLALFFSCLRSYYFNYAFQLVSLTKYLISITAIAALVNVTLNFFLIPVYGIVGAAYATIAAFFSALVSSILFGRHSFSMPSIDWLQVLGILFAVAGMVGAVRLIKIDVVNIELAVKVGVGGLIYTLFLLVFNVSNSRHWIAKIILRN